MSLPINVRLLAPKASQPSLEAVASVSKDGVKLTKKSSGQTICVLSFEQLRGWNIGGEGKVLVLKATRNGQLGEIKLEGGGSLPEVALKELRDELTKFKQSAANAPVASSITSPAKRRASTSLSSAADKAAQLRATIAEKQANRKTRTSNATPPAKTRVGAWSNEKLEVKRRSMETSAALSAITEKASTSTFRPIEDAPLRNVSPPPRPETVLPSRPKAPPPPRPKSPPPPRPSVSSPPRPSRSPPTPSSPAVSKRKSSVTSLQELTALAQSVQRDSSSPPSPPPRPPPRNPSPPPRASQTATSISPQAESAIDNPLHDSNRGALEEELVQLRDALTQKERTIQSLRTENASKNEETERLSSTMLTIKADRDTAVSGVRKAREDASNEMRRSTELEARLRDLETELRNAKKTNGGGIPVEVKEELEAAMDEREQMEVQKVVMQERLVQESQLYTSIELLLEKSGRLENRKEDIVEERDSAPAEQVELKSYIESCASMEPLDDEDLVRLSRRAKVRLYQANAVICTQGRTALEAYVILEGSLVLQQKDGREIVVEEEIGPGAIINELSLLFKSPADSTIRNTGASCTLAVLTVSDVEKALSTRRDILEKVQEITVTQPEFYASAMMPHVDTLSAVKEALLFSSNYKKQKNNDLEAMSRKDTENLRNQVEVQEKTIVDLQAELSGVKSILEEQIEGERIKSARISEELLDKSEHYKELELENENLQRDLTSLKEHRAEDLRDALLENTKLKEIVKDIEKSRGEVTEELRSVKAQLTQMSMDKVKNDPEATRKRTSSMSTPPIVTDNGSTEAALRQWRDAEAKLAEANVAKRQLEDSVSLAKEEALSKQKDYEAEIRKLEHVIDENNRQLRDSNGAKEELEQKLRDIGIGIDGFNRGGGIREALANLQGNLSTEREARLTAEKDLLYATQELETLKMNFNQENTKPGSSTDMLPISKFFSILFTIDPLIAPRERSTLQITDASIVISHKDSGVELFSASLTQILGWAMTDDELTIHLHEGGLKKDLKMGLSRQGSLGVVASIVKALDDTKLPEDIADYSHGMQIDSSVQSPIGNAPSSEIVGVMDHLQAMTDALNKRLENVESGDDKEVGSLSPLAKVETEEDRFDPSALIAELESIDGALRAVYEILDLDSDRPIDVDINRSRRVSGFMTKVLAFFKKFKSHMNVSIAHAAEVRSRSILAISEQKSIFLQQQLDSATERSRHLEREIDRIRSDDFAEKVISAKKDMVPLTYDPNGLERVTELENELRRVREDYDNAKIQLSFMETFGNQVQNKPPAIVGPPSSGIKNKLQLTQLQAKYKQLEDNLSMERSKREDAEMKIAQVEELYADAFLPQINNNQVEAELDSLRTRNGELKNNLSQEGERLRLALEDVANLGKDNDILRQRLAEKSPMKGPSKSENNNSTTTNHVQAEKEKAMGDSDVGGVNRSDIMTKLSSVRAQMKQLSADAGSNFTSPSRPSRVSPPRPTTSERSDTSSAKLLSVIDNILGAV